MGSFQTSFSNVLQIAEVKQVAVDDAFSQTVLFWQNFDGRFVAWLHQTILYHRFVVWACTKWTLMKGRAKHVLIINESNQSANGTCNTAAQPAGGSILLGEKGRKKGEKLMRPPTGICCVFFETRATSEKPVKTFPLFMAHSCLFYGLHQWSTESFQRRNNQSSLFV